MSINVASKSLAQRLDSLKGKLIFTIVVFVASIVASQMVEASIRASSHSNAASMAIALSVIFAGLFAYATVLNRAQQLSEGWKRLAILSGIIGAPFSVLLAFLGLLPLPAAASVFELILVGIAGSGCGLTLITAIVWVFEGFNRPQDRS
jgi:hypothetical protein